MHAWSRSPRQRGEDIRAHACSSGSSEAGNAAHIVMSPVLATTSPDTCSSGCYIGRGRVVTLSHDTPNSVCLQVESHVSAVALEAWIDPADPLVCACARIYQRFNTNPVRSVVHSQAWQLIWKLPTKRRRRQTDLMWSCGLGELCRSRKQLRPNLELHPQPGLSVGPQDNTAPCMLRLAKLYVLSCCSGLASDARCVCMLLRNQTTAPIRSIRERERESERGRSSYTAYPEKI